MSGRLAVIAAGGTGGHLFPAQALAEALGRRGWRIVLASDDRVASMADSFPAEERIPLSAATFKSGDPLGAIRAGAAIIKGVLQARAALKRLDPDVVVGFGGYPSFPTLVGAITSGRKTVIHEQNAVMGRANRVLAKMADAVASSFPELRGLPERAAQKLTITGNPVRDIVLAQKAAAFPVFGPFRLLVFGGSQGAQFFGEFMPKVFAEMAPEDRKAIRLTQQVRQENLSQVRATYAGLDVDCELSPFFTDMPARIAASHLVVCRSGASTIAELGVIGRPAIMVPLPHAIDNDQLRNAESFAAAGAGWIHPQATLEPKAFAAFLTRLASQEGQLRQAAAAALGHGKPDAARRLADLTERLAGKKPQ